MLFSEEKLAEVKADKLINETAYLAQRSRNSYVEESFLPVEKVEDHKIRVNPLNGIFISSELSWDLLIKNLGLEYDITNHPAGKEMETKMGLVNVFPPLKIERNFPKQSLESFCKEEITFKPFLFSKSEATQYLQIIKEQANETEEWASPLINWLEAQQLPGFYNVIEFKIFNEFDFQRYYVSLKQSEELKRKDENNKIVRTIDTSEELIKQLDDEAIKQLDDEAKELAEWAIDYVTKELVFDDLVRAINETCLDKSVKLKGLSERYLTYPILIYTPLKLKLIIKINDDKTDEVKINLAKKIKVKASVINYDTTRNIKVDNLKVVVESGYLKEKPIQFDDTNWKSGRDEIGNYSSIDSNEVFVPADINKIIKDEANIVYPIFFSLIKSVYLKENVSKDIVLTKRDIKLCKSQLNVRFEKPKIRFSVTRPYFPRKGQQFDVEFKVWFEESDLDYKIPIKVVCYYGDDFMTLKSKSDNDDKKYSESLYIGKSKEQATFILIAKKASFPGYYNAAYFEFFIGESQKETEAWRLNLTVLPNVLDTLVAGLTVLLGALAMTYPDIFPPITEQVNIANLEIIPATIYLGYRILFWSKSTTK